MLSTALLALVSAAEVASPADFDSASAVAAVQPHAAESFSAFAALTVAVPSADVPLPPSDPHPAPMSAPVARRVVASVVASSERGLMAVLSGDRRKATDQHARRSDLDQRGGGPLGPPPGPIDGIGPPAAPCCVTGVPRKHPIVYGKAVVAW